MGNHLMLRRCRLARRRLASVSVPIGFVLVVFAIALLQPGNAPGDPASGEYTWAEATALNLPHTDDFVKDPSLSMPDCPPIDTADPGLGPDEEPPADAPECWQPPEDQDLVFIVTSTPMFDFTGEQAPPIDINRHIGARAEDHVYKGAQNVEEVQDPEVCHTNGCPDQHFYSRIALISSNDAHSFEVGWMERNYGKTATNTQHAAVAFDPLNAVIGRRFPVNPGSARGFRGKQCGSPGQRLVCGQIYNGSKWRTIVHPWRGTMGCQNSDGSGKCKLNFAEESASTDGMSWFALNGGPDGLRMRNIRVWFGTSSIWPLYDANTFSDGVFADDPPYFICRTHSWYHYTGALGMPQVCQ